MKLDDLEISLKEIKRLSKKVVFKLEKRGIKNLKDLFFYFPYKYHDFTKIKKIKDLKINEPSLISGKITNLKIFRSPRGKMFILQGIISDETGSIKIIWFNQPYLFKELKDEPEIIAYGKLSLTQGNLNFQPQKFSRLDKKKSILGKIVPVYKEIEGLRSSYLEKIILSFLKEYEIENLEDPLPEFIKEKFKFPSLGESIFYLHQPPNYEVLKRAQERIIFEEMFYLQLALLHEKMNLSKEKAIIIKKNENLIKEFMAQFNFDLTPGQKRVLDEIFSDLSQGIPMNRLLQGETGSGKTLIAEILSLHFLKEGYQVVFMAPTEILALQHFQRMLQHFSRYDFGLGLLTSGNIYYGLKGFRSNKYIYEILRLLAQNKINFLIGTHALIENELTFAKLGLIIIDEQQRFGINQRKKLLENTNQDFLPHFLSMTATPIPRTLALALYGDLSFSFLEDKPFGTKPVKTFIIFEKKKEEIMWKLVRKEIKENHQVFIICPRIEEKDDEIASVKKEFEEIKKIFPENIIGLLHGKMSSFEKEMILKKMQKGEIKILVASSVVEVGIDLPLATIMIIKSPENFGLSQLYQLRGRIGRSIHQGYCFLLPQKLTPKAKQRLVYFLKAKSALELSEYDLKVRGAGEFFGIKQSGIPDLVMRHLVNTEIIIKAKKISEEIIDNLEHFPQLKKEVLKRRKILLNLA